MIDERKNVQTTPPAPTASAVGPFPTLIQISRTPRLCKFTQHHRTTRSPLQTMEGTLKVQGIKRWPDELAAPGTNLGPAGDKIRFMQIEFHYTKPFIIVHSFDTTKILVKIAEIHQSSHPSIQPSLEKQKRQVQPSAYGGTELVEST